ncbi:hypothetical protein QYF36_006242 [Acer negundo]|nr:hypothetical protein QYF36_006242 [Acer negundo]
MSSTDIHLKAKVVPETLEPSLAVTSRCSCTASTPDVISITITTSIEEVSSNAKPIIRQIQKAPKRIKKLLDMLFQQEVNEEEASLFDMFWLLLASVMFVPLFQKIPYGCPVLCYLAAGILISAMCIGQKLLRNLELFSCSLILAWRWNPFL